MFAMSSMRVTKGDALTTELRSSMREYGLRLECLGMSRPGVAISDKAALGYRVRKGDMWHLARLSEEYYITSVNLESTSLSGCAKGEARGACGVCGGR